MKKFFIFILAIAAIVFSVSADTINTVNVKMPACVRVIQDSIFSVNVRGVDANAVKYEIKNDTIYFRTNKSDLERPVILITSPNPDKLEFITSREYEMRYCK